jgi:hypothetical protein
MSFLFGSPDPPDPVATAGAQTGTNVNTALANNALQQVNQNTPQGNLTYSQTGNYSFVDPTTGVSYNIPQSTATQTLTPAGQATFDQSQQAQYNLAALGNSQTQRLNQQFNSPFNIMDPQKYLQQNPDVLAYAQQIGWDPIAFAKYHYQQNGMAEGRTGGAPEFGNVNSLTGAPQARGSFADAGPIGSTFGESGGIQRSYQHGDDFSADRQRIESGLMERLNPSLAIERNKYEQQLADQGIRYGSPAYENAMRNYSMQANDARLGVIGQAGAEQSRLSEMAKAAGEFSNNAAQQQYEQLYGRANFANAAQQQQFAQNAQRGTFNNAALAQNFQQAGTAFNAANAARQQYLDEQFALRNQPINEISALLSGSQVSKPSFLNTGGATIPTTDVAGLINRNFDQQMAVSNQQSATANNIIGGLFGFAGGLGRGGFFNSGK